METLPRPDIILRDEKRKTVTKAHMAIAVEDYKKNSLGTVRIDKEEKYQAFKTHYGKREYRETVLALVYGSSAVIAQEKQKLLSQEQRISEN
ncbi:hypothetical protein, conserved [Eimeria acervulina]|uniref:Uncharacterized protein n=1 Tax=Eimeria acervulina TaxID=5801 RepID=U6GU96_EIMAC|nr:hypothetical protein, conserved [Eimeria acervulina]CDI83117.1 hypothetical protein, conserved [Eimeria acervulina]